MPAVRHVTVALVQQGIQPSRASRVNASLRLSEGLGAARPDLIVWGESSVGYDIERADTGLLDRIEALAAGTGAQILVNQDSTLPGGGKSKVALLIGPHGVAGSYVKTRLVPFGEYIPFRGALGWLTSISKAAPSNMIPGDGAHLIHAVDRAGQPLPLGVLICFESAFPDMSRVDADLGAQLIIYQTSDSTFQSSWAPAQHASLSAVRAAETGRPVVQAALTGDTVAFDARGRLLALMTSAHRGRDRAAPRAAPGQRADPLRPAGRLPALGGHRRGRGHRRRLAHCFSPASAGTGTFGGQLPACRIRLSIGRASRPRFRFRSRRRRRRRAGSSGRRRPTHLLSGPHPTGGPLTALRERAQRVPGRPGAPAGSGLGGSRVRESDNTHGQRGVGSGGQGGTTRRCRMTVLAALSAVVCLVVAACSSGAPSATGSAGQPSGKASAHAVTAASAALSITPANGARRANPAKGVVVKASEGKIQSVTVTAGHDAVSGSLNSGAHGLAERLGAAAVAELHRARHRGELVRQDGQLGEQLPHADPRRDQHRDDLRGVQAELRRRHPDPARRSARRSPTGPRWSGRCR